jgi:hypothetical protein
VPVNAQKEVLDYWTLENVHPKHFTHQETGQGKDSSTYHGPQVEFDTSRLLDHLAPERFRVSEVMVWSDEYVAGLSVVYEIDGKRVQDPPHLGFNVQKLPPKHFVLDADERIERIAGRIGDVLHLLSITTSHRVETFGRASGGALFTLAVP